MEKKNTGLIVLVVILLVSVLGLGGFIVYDKILVNDKPINDEKINLLKNEDINLTLRCHDYKNKCNILTAGNFDISRKIIFNKENQEISNEYYINGKTIENDYYVINNVRYYNPIKKLYILDDDYVFIEFEELTKEGTNKYYMYNSNAEKIYDFNDFGKRVNINYDNKKFIVEKIHSKISDTLYLGCNTFKDDEIVKTKEEIEYLGNGRLSKSKVLTSKTWGEVMRERYNMSCNDIKNSTSEELRHIREALQ